jgi:hypothetical protein
MHRAYCRLRFDGGRGDEERRIVDTVMVDMKSKESYFVVAKHLKVPRRQIQCAERRMRILWRRAVRRQRRRCRRCGRVPTEPRRTAGGKLLTSA